MNEKLTKAIDFAKYRQSLAVKRKTIKEKVDAKLTFGANGGIFKIDQSLIAFTQMLIDQGRVKNVPMMDANDNPIMIEDLQAFRDDILDKYFSALLEYHNAVADLKKARSVEKLLEL